jgi:cyclohexa-1,5-dienecarbonyl-CoA hydratase
MKKLKFNRLHGNAVAQVILDDGKGNVIDHVMMDEIREVLFSFRDDTALKLIVFEGAGKHFSFGASVEEHRREFAEAMIRGFHQLFYLLRDLAIPTAAKISGQCLGGGLELAIMCNFMFADKTARLGQPEITLGVFPPPASIILPEKIGLARAEELLLTGKAVTGEKAAAMGLVNEVFEDRQALDEGFEKWIAEYILPRSASSLKLAVRASRIKFNHLIANFLPQLESIYLNQLMSTHDANEGIESFLSKRKPEWNNN